MVIADYLKLLTIENSDQITAENHYEFIHQLQYALLLALREKGKLNAVQYRQAEEQLNRQRRSRAKRILEKEELS